MTTFSSSEEDCQNGDEHCKERECEDACRSCCVLAFCSIEFESLDAFRASAEPVTALGAIQIVSTDIALMAALVLGASNTDIIDKLVSSNAGAAHGLTVIAFVAVFRNITHIGTETAFCRDAGNTFGILELVIHRTRGTSDALLTAAVAVLLVLSLVALTAALALTTGDTLVVDQTEALHTGSAGRCTVRAGQTAQIARSEISSTAALVCSTGNTLVVAVHLEALRTRLADRPAGITLVAVAGNIAGVALHAALTSSTGNTVAGGRVQLVAKETGSTGSLVRGAGGAVRRDIAVVSFGAALVGSTGNTLLTDKLEALMAGQTVIIAIRITGCTDVAVISVITTLFAGTGNTTTVRGELIVGRT